MLFNQLTGGTWTNPETGERWKLESKWRSRGQRAGLYAWPIDEDGNPSCEGYLDLLDSWSRGIEYAMSLRAARVPTDEEMFEITTKLPSPKSRIPIFLSPKPGMSILWPIYGKREMRIFVTLYSPIGEEIAYARTRYAAKSEDFRELVGGGRERVLQFFRRYLEGDGDIGVKDSDIGVCLPSADYQPK